MEWIFGIYLAWGVFKIFCLLGDENVAQKPMWMYAEKNPLKWALYFAGCVVFWPFVKIST